MNLNNQIESLRKELVELLKERGDVDEEVKTLRKKIDALLEEYYKIQRAIL